MVGGTNNEVTGLCGMALGSNNDVAGEWGLGLGSAAKVQDDFAAVLGFNSACYSKGDATVNICATNGVYFSSGSSSVSVAQLAERSTKLRRPSRR